MRIATRLFILILFPFSVCSQDFPRKYGSLIYHNGAEEDIVALLHNWQKQDPHNADLAYCRLHYYYTRSFTPLIPLPKDSLVAGFGKNAVEKVNGRSVAHIAYGYRFNDSLFNLALVAIDEGIRFNRNRFDLYYAKTRALSSAGRMDECEAQLIELVTMLGDHDYSWQEDGKTAITEAEVKYYINRQLGSYAVCDPPSYETILHVSQKMLSYFPEDTLSISYAADACEQLGNRCRSFDTAAAYRFYDNSIGHLQHLLLLAPARHLALSCKIGELAEQKKDYKAARKYYALVETSANVSLPQEKDLADRARKGEARISVLFEQ